nr:hypothetical protein [Tanacetum cinerariifolium]
MVACVVCAEGECSADCIFVDVFPADNEESKINAEKVLSGWPVNYVKELLMQAKRKNPSAPGSDTADRIQRLVKDQLAKHAAASAPSSLSSYADRIQRLADQLAKPAAASTPPRSAFSSAPALPADNDADLN